MWRFLGPNNRSGRVTDLVVDPANADHVHAATADGLRLGDDGGASWTTLTNGETPNPLAGEISDALLDPNDPDTLYAVVHGGGLYRVSFAASSYTVERLDETRSYFW